MKILVVEDQPALRAGLTDLLESAGHTVEAVPDGLEAIRVGTAGHFDVVVLDVMLPRRDGIEVCRRLRDRHPDLAILMLTARGSEDDKVIGFRAGADDYVTKPFGARELLARIDALGRRATRDAAAPARVEIDGCVLDLDRQQAWRGTHATPLTARESEILRLLHLHRTRAVTRAELLEEIWGADGAMLTRTVDVTIAKLRRKIERDPSSPRILVTIKGAGYAWGDDGRPGGGDS